MQSKPCINNKNRITYFVIKLIDCTTIMSYARKRTYCISSIILIKKEEKIKTVSGNYHNQQNGCSCIKYYFPTA